MAWSQLFIKTMDLEFRGRRNLHLVQKGNFMVVKIELYAEGRVNKVVLGSSQHSFCLWKQFMLHGIQQYLVNLAGNGNLLTPGRVHDWRRCYWVLWAELSIEDWGEVNGSSRHNVTVLKSSQIPLFWWQMHILGRRELYIKQWPTYTS